MKFEDILFWIFMVIAIILFAWFIFGGGPTIEQSLLVFLIGFAIKLHGDIRELKGGFEMHIKTMHKNKKK